MQFYFYDLKDAAARAEQLRRQHQPLNAAIG